MRLRDGSSLWDKWGIMEVIKVISCRGSCVGPTCRDTHVQISGVDTESSKGKGQYLEIYCKDIGAAFPLTFVDPPSSKGKGPVLGDLL
ncbi:hypothetical protein Scep_030364 [Stephania cephalantha]|uniref:Uncharacterized protein n=1 Tax=Stephania cephalantha TaxID=152367 RepID=A0AAP0HD31_9MAGN